VTISDATSAQSGNASCATSTRGNVALPSPNHVVTAAIASAGSQVRYIARPAGA
jgi:hypothetical protein